MSWTPEKEKKLRELWKKGYSASQISSLIEGTTRNAVIGKAHRLNLEARAKKVIIWQLLKDAASDCSGFILSTLPP